VDVSAAIHPITVSQPTAISSKIDMFWLQRTGDVAAEFLVSSRCKERHPVILASGRGDGTRKLADADEDGEVPKPDEREAVNESSRTATRMIEHEREM
jgi:hypothetical protein